MQLEDHAGDVVRKARQMKKLSINEVSAAVGMKLEELSAVENNGISLPSVNWASLALTLGLDAAKLQRLAEGWSPALLDTDICREIRRITTNDEGITVNAYLIWDEVTREAALFDTGWDPAPIFALVEEYQLQLKHLFITHTHDDHIAALTQIRERFPKIHLHTNSRSAPPQHRNRTNDFIHLGGLRITNRDTPGHAEDGVTYVVGNFPEDAPHAAIVGDAIFAGSVGGATEFPELAIQKICDQIFSLPPETIICPGHGPLTTVGEQLLHNPFFPGTRMSRFQASNRC